MQETDAEDGRSALADEHLADEHLAELWNGSFHLACRRWLAGVGGGAHRTRGGPEPPAATPWPSDGRSNHRLLG